MPKKKVQINGYSLFLRDVRKQYERAGNYFPKNNQEAFVFVGPLWKKLSEEEKTRYNNLAKSEKRNGGSELENKFNSLGISYAEIEAEKREREEYQDIMRNTIKGTVQNADFNTTFFDQKFYVGHVNYFYVNNEDKFKPAEIALSEFNLRKGVVNRFHAFIDPGPVETGFRLKAMQQSESTHLIPIEDPSWKLGERDYFKLFSEIKNFLCKDNQRGLPPPIYTMPDNVGNNYSISAVKSTIETLCEAANEEPSKMRVYELPLLYHEMRVRAASTKDPDKASLFTLSMALQDLERDCFQYAKNIACQFHEDKDPVHHCSLSMVTRWVFSMCDFLLNYLPVSPIEGGHCPQNSRKAAEVYKNQVFDDDENEDEDDYVPLRKPNIQTMDKTDYDYYSERLTDNYKNSQNQLDDDGFQLVRKQGSRSAAGSSKGRYQYDTSAAATPNLSQSSVLSSLAPGRNLSQSTAMSGYTASASLSQSSNSSEVSTDALPFIGRGRGVPRSHSTQPTLNWALNVGRGSKLKQQPNNQ